MTIIINFNSNKELDIALIPSDIYNETINNQTVIIQDYFIKNPLILFSFVGFNSKLKLANQLSSNKKCGCFYNIPWKTRYQELNKISQMTITFSQQVEEYRYMISLERSYMQYLSQIALTIIMDIKQFLYYRSNNLENCTIFNKKYYKDNFKNNKQFLYYVTTYFLKI